MSSSSPTRLADQPVPQGVAIVFALAQIGFGMVLLYASSAVGWWGYSELRDGKRLKTNGMSTQATIERLFRARNGRPRLEYSFVDEKGDRYQRDTLIDPVVWEGLAKEFEVAIRYVPSNPAYSRLVEGEIPPKHPAPSKIFIAIFMLGMAGTFLFRGIRILIA